MGVGLVFLNCRNFWRRHRRKILVASGVIGTGYFLYRLYNGHQRRLSDLERELANERELDELLKAQMQAHFENIQRIADSVTLPHSMEYLSCRIAEELDLSPLTERLMRGKDQPNTLTSVEKIELWERLKLQSFTKMVVSLWAVTMLSLYTRVQVNILGRRLYIDTARDLGSAILIEDADLIDREDEQKYLASADFLANNGITTLISCFQAAAGEILKGKQLKDFCNGTILRATAMQIIDRFMGNGSPHHWLDYIIPADLNKLSIASTSDATIHPNASKFDLLMMETRAVLSSAEFGNVVEVSLKAMVDGLIEEMERQSEGNFNIGSGMPLAKILPRLVQICPSILNRPGENPFLQIIKDVQEVEIFFTLLYGNTGNA
ncbi:peroxisome biogenesis protein 3-2-like [Rutidosis leptorrhynchoides]|uniref:peroxisome biogenesis protein 3-2-like n=1 Tax=Rutidosis leptorrhynchoides TaxID=125765 RepID=UPI003A99486A